MWRLNQRKRPDAARQNRMTAAMMERIWGIEIEPQMNSPGCIFVASIRQLQIRSSAFEDRLPQFS